MSLNSIWVTFTWTSFTWYVALGWKDVRAFFPVDVAGEAQLGDDLKSPLAQAHAVLGACAHVFPVNPLYFGGATRAWVHRDAACAADRKEKGKRATRPRACHSLAPATRGARGRFGESGRATAWFCREPIGKEGTECSDTPRCLLDPDCSSSYLIISYFHNLG